MRKGRLLLVIVVAVVAAMYLGIIPKSLTIGGTDVTTAGVGYKSHSLEGNSFALGARELLDSEAYVTSWNGGNSEKLSLQGQVRFYSDSSVYGSLGHGLVQYWYQVAVSGANERVKINGQDTANWQSVKKPAPSAINTGSSWFSMESVVVQITGTVEGKVSAIFWGTHYWYEAGFGGIPIKKWADTPFATDEAYLRSGIGSVKCQEDVVEEGQTAHFYVETNYAHSANPIVPSTDQGWVLTVYSPSGANVFSKSLTDGMKGTVGWLVPSGSYSSTGTNQYRVVLHNELVNQDDDWFFTVGPGQSTQVPGLPSFEMTIGTPPFKPGDQITVKISAIQTNNPIKGFWVWVSYETSAGTTTEYLIKDKWYSASVSGTTATATVSWTFPDAGNCRLEASAADSLNLNSGISEMKWTVQGTTGPDNTFTPTFDWAQLVYVLAALVGAVLIWFKAPIPREFKLILVVALIAVAFYFAWPLMTTDYSSHATWIPSGVTNG